VIIVLDTTPLGLVTQKPGKSNDADACATWVATLIRAGHRIMVPEIVDYEVRRELKRAGQNISIARLDAFNSADLQRYIALTTTAMRLAADLWAEARNTGLATAHKHALDGDVILAAQALSMGADPSDFVVATQNVKHLSRFVRCDFWSNVKP
jgi:hypothetical protein